MIWTVGACSTRATLTHRPRPSAPDRPPGWPGSRPPATSVSRSLSPGWPSPHARRPGWLAPAVLQSSRLPSLSLAGWLSCSVSPLVRFLLPLLSPYPFHRWARQGSNLRPRDYESPALTTELRALARTVIDACSDGVGCYARRQGAPSRRVPRAGRFESSPVTGP